MSPEFVLHDGIPLHIVYTMSWRVTQFFHSAKDAIHSWPALTVPVCKSFSKYNIQIYP